MERSAPLRPVRLLAVIAIAAVLGMGIGLVTGCAVPKGAVKGKSAPSSGVAGTVFAPAEGVYVYVYKKGADPYGPADVILHAPTTADGTFLIDLPHGDYVLVARRRANLENSGPMMAGDQRSQPVAVQVRKGRKLSLNLLMNTKEDTEIRSFTPPTEWTTAFAGMVRDPDGNPVEGARVHVYTYVQMSERPKYVSERTGPDGKYIISLPKGGTYYLAARNRFGGPPRIGDLYGRYEEGSINPTGVVVRTGEKREGLDITVFKVW